MRVLYSFDLSNYVAKSLSLFDHCLINLSGWPFTIFPDLCVLSVILTSVLHLTLSAIDRLSYENQHDTTINAKCSSNLVLFLRSS